MELREMIDKIDALKAELDAMGPLPKDARERLEQKVRMEWNYHSNVIEGNTLDYGETRSLLLHGITAKGKPLKDHLDLEGHNEALKQLEEIVRKELPITENLIKDFHKLILAEPFEDYRGDIEVGEIKHRENYLYNARGERIDFCPPEGVPARLNTLINWINNAITPPKRKKKQYDVHPLLIAAKFHLEFILIHPFDDGNGRLARIFMNLILMQCGYPPVIIPLKERDEYFNALNEGREKGVETLAEYLGGRLIEALELYLKAARGESLEEPDDLDKKIRLLEMELEAIAIEDEVQKEFSSDVFFEIYDSWLSDLLHIAVSTIQKFNRLFTKVRHGIDASNGIGGVAFTNEPPDIIIKKLKEEFLRNKSDLDRVGTFDVYLWAIYEAFTKGGLNTFDLTYRLRISFTRFKYHIDINESYLHETNEVSFRETVFSEKLLHQPVNEPEIKSITNIIGSSIYNYIDNKTLRAQIRKQKNDSSSK